MGTPDQASLASLEDMGGSKLAANLKEEVQRSLEPMRQELLSLSGDMTMRTESIEGRVELVERSLLESFMALEHRLTALVKAVDNGYVVKQERDSLKKQLADAIVDR